MTESVIHNVALYTNELPKYGYVHWKNHLAPIHSITLKNLDDTACRRRLRVSLTSEGDWIAPCEWMLDPIPGNSVRVVNCESLTVGKHRLHALAHNEMRGVTIQVHLDDSIIAEKQVSIQLLAYNEWGGMGYLPEYLAGFVMPDDPAVERLLIDAEKLLIRADKRCIRDGYESGKRRHVLEWLSSIYTAAANYRVTLEDATPGYETEGQTIRFPCQIINSTVVTNLDIALFMAAALERLRLNPVVVVLQGQSCVGVWFNAQSHPYIVIDSPEVVRAAVDRNELVLIQPALATIRPPWPFTRARAAGRDLIEGEHNTRYIAAIDIRRARKSCLQPLGHLSGGEETAQDAPTGTSGSTVWQPPSDTEDSGAGDESTERRVARWQRRLLDITLSNRLKDQRHVNKHLSMVCPDPVGLARELERGRTYSIQTLLAAEREGLAQASAINTDGSVCPMTLAGEAMAHGMVLLDMSDDELQTCLSELFFKVNHLPQDERRLSLCLMLDAIHWRRSPKDRVPFRAPVVVIPVQLEQEPGRTGYRLVGGTDPAYLNHHLIETLHQDMGVTFPAGEPTLEHRDGGLDLSRIESNLGIAINEMVNLDLVKEVGLGLYSDSRYLMWQVCREGASWVH